MSIQIYNAHTMACIASIRNVLINLYKKRGAVDAQDPVYEELTKAISQVCTVAVEFGELVGALERDVCKRSNFNMYELMNECRPMDAPPIAEGVPESRGSFNEYPFDDRRYAVVERKLQPPSVRYVYEVSNSGYVMNNPMPLGGKYCRVPSITDATVFPDPIEGQSTQVLQDLIDSGIEIATIISEPIVDFRERVKLKLISN